MMPKICSEDQLSLNVGQKYCRKVLLTYIKLPHDSKAFVLSISEMLLKTCYTVASMACMHGRKKIIDLISI